MFYLLLLLGIVVMVALAAAPTAMGRRRTAATERAGWADGRFARRAQPHLEDGETVLQTAIAVLVATAKGERLRIPHAGPARLGSAVGERLLRAGAVRGGPGSTAALMPRAGGGTLLVLTDGSSAALLTPNPSTTGLLQRHLGPAA